MCLFCLSIAHPVVGFASLVDEIIADAVALTTVTDVRSPYFRLRCALLQQRARAIEGHIGAGGGDATAPTADDGSPVSAADSAATLQRLQFCVTQLRKMASGERVSTAQLNDVLFQAATAPSTTTGAAAAGSGQGAAAGAGAGAAGTAAASAAATGGATGARSAAAKSSRLLEERTPRFPAPLPTDNNSLFAITAGDRLADPITLVSSSWPDRCCCPALCGCGGAGCGNLSGLW